MTDIPHHIPTLICKLLNLVSFPLKKQSVEHLILHIEFPHRGSTFKIKANQGCTLTEACTTVFDLHVKSLYNCTFAFYPMHAKYSHICIGRNKNSAQHPSQKRLTPA